LEFEYLQSRSFAGGTTHEIQKLINEFDLEQSDWTGILQWILQATKNPNEPMALYAKKNIGDFWRREHDSLVERQVQWVEDCCKTVPGFPKTLDLYMKLTGGGLLDATLFARVSTTIQTQLPGAILRDDRYSDES
jgi:hypothetical protein